MKRIQYKAGYKYQLFTSCRVATSIKPLADIEQPFITLKTTGTLIVKAGYAWDGPSGPVIDSKRKMRASLIHDALYQLRRQLRLSAGDMLLADALFRDICIQDGLAPWRARLYYFGLRKFGRRARDPENKRAVMAAP